MPEDYVNLEEAAAFEGISYNTLKKRVQRNPRAYKTQQTASAKNGKPQVLVAVSSLSPKGRRAWRATRKVDGGEVIMEKRTDAAPWYVDADLNHYI